MNTEWYLKQIGIVIFSPLVDQYLVGITSNAENRRRSYIAEQFSSFIILDINLKMNDALEIEKNLFNILVNDKASLFYKKYHKDKRDDHYHRSTGGRQEISYSLYLAAF
jgi:hypothetical protein